MADLPVRPSIEHLRGQARDLLRAARSGDAAAAARLAAVPGGLTLAAAQLALAREHGYPSWTRLKTAVEAAAADADQLAREFCVASIRDWTGRAARLLAARPELAAHSLATAVVLGDAARVRDRLRRDPAAAVRPVEENGWTPLHLAAASRWHQLDPGRAAGLTEVARLLLDAGAAGAGPVVGQHWTPLRCAIAGAVNAPIVALLLERGAVPDDEDLYLAGFGGDEGECLRLLLPRVPDVRAVAAMALAAPLSSGDTESVALLLDAGADPRRFADDADEPAPVLYAAVRCGVPAGLAALLLDHGADPAAPGPDGRSPRTLAAALGREDLAALLASRGAPDDSSAADRLLAACQRADRAAAERLLGAGPGILTEAQQADAMVRAAETGNEAAAGLMLSLGFPVSARASEDGATPLHAAGYAGSAGVARLLLAAGADLEARDARFDSTPLDWACVGSGERPAGNPRADWTATARVLLDAGSSTAGISLSPDEPKQPSPEVAEILRAAMAARR